MSRKDTFHDIVRRALEKDGWTITHDPLLLRYELGNLSHPQQETIEQWLH